MPKACRNTQSAMCVFGEILNNKQSIKSIPCPFERRRRKASKIPSKNDLLTQQFLGPSRSVALKPRSYLTPQSRCCRLSRSRWSEADSLPWLGCPWRGSCILGIWGHTDTSSHCPCRWILPRSCRRCSSELPVQNAPEDSRGGEPAGLKEQTQQTSLLW